MKTLRRLLTLALLAPGAFLLWAFLNAEPPAAPPILAKAEVGAVVRTILASGMLEAKTLVSVGARVSGQIETLAVKLGDSVKAGDLIAQIDSQDQRNAVLQAEASLSQIAAQIAAKRASLDRAELTLNRQQRLGAQSFATQSAVESANADVLVYRAELQALEAQRSNAETTVAIARVALDRTRVTAPIGGVVVAVPVKQGQTVNAQQSAPTIVKLADLSTMRVNVEISEADVMSVAPGQSASFTTLGAPQEVFRAALRQVEPAPDAIASSDEISSDAAVYYNGRLEVANPERRLRIGMSAEVTIEIARAEGVLTAPSAAVKSDAEGRYVEVFDPAARQIAKRRVTVGLDDKVTAEIRSGLAAGESVVVGAATAPPPAASRGPGGGMMGGGPPPMF